MQPLASSFDAMWTLAGWALLLLIALASLVPSFRGHGSGVLLVASAVSLNATLDPQIAAGAGTGAATPGQWVVFLLPMVVGIVSAGVWFARRSAREKRG